MILGATPAEDKLKTEWHGIRISDGKECSISTIHKRLEGSLEGK